MKALERQWRLRPDHDGPVVAVRQAAWQFTTHEVLQGRDVFQVLVNQRPEQPGDPVVVLAVDLLLARIDGLHPGLQLSLLPGQLFQAGEGIRMSGHRGTSSSDGATVAGETAVEQS